MRLSRFYLAIILTFCASANFALADDFSSTNFTVKDPVIAEPASYGTSSNFGLWGTMPNIAPTSGTSTNFGVNPGFLAFTGLTMPALSATAATSSLSLSWTAAGGVTTTVTYEPGLATAPGGPYSYGPTQLTLSAIIDTLTPSTAYYLIVRVKEQSGGALLGYSNELAISTLSISSSTSSPSTSSGSGGLSPGDEIIIAPIGWIFGPDGLVPVMDIDELDGRDMVAPGEAVTITPQLLRQFGAVVAIAGGTQVPVTGAEMTLWRLDTETDEFELWPSKELSVIYTDNLGLFSFLVPVGTYQMQIEAAGYLKYKSPPMRVDLTGQFVQRVELTAKLGVDMPLPWLIVLLLASLFLIGVMIMLLMKFIFRR